MRLTSASLASRRRGFEPSSYYDSHFRQGAALIRARRPYIYKAQTVGLLLVGVAASIYIYTIKAIGQDEFEDVLVPDGPRTDQKDK